ncbi:hypothetical protein CQ025_15065 [Pseudomonas sp. MYb3]|nr:hypothetical protein CQ025_15065 [Pseudomonas sp. MYb3]
MAVGQSMVMLAGLAQSLASQLPQGFLVCRRLSASHKTCGSELACEGGGSINSDVDCAGLIASRASSHIFFEVSLGLMACHKTVGAGLPAMAVGQSMVMLAGLAQSLASQLPQGFLVCRRLSVFHKTCGS